MKKIIGLIFAITVLLLFVTKSLYVDWKELIIIVASLSVVSIVLNKHQNRFSDILGRSAILGFVLCLTFGSIDLMADHFMYFLPTGNEDGMPLSLGMKFNEYSDDLFVVSLISMVSVIIISILVALILKFKAQNYKENFKFNGWLCSKRNLGTFFRSHY
ncbi:hypothetical protein V7138_01605 [Bacillus sp. JJ1533]|uniref:hypothetical protein n=1 Tax=Bacillus sp. JJ1533 TaxID=3122959 RepID=UPI002FFFFE01